MLASSCLCLSRASSLCRFLSLLRSLHALDCTPQSKDRRLGDTMTTNSITYTPPADFTKPGGWFAGRGGGDLLSVGVGVMF